MTFATRILLILTVALSIAGRLAAQEMATAAQEATTTVAAEEAGPAGTPEQSAAPSSYDVRNQFTTLLRQSPPELAMILALDPTLLSNEAFLTGYPELSRFVAQNPEVRRSPRFYLAEFPVPGQGGHALEQITGILAVGALWVLIVFALAWLVRTIIEQKRWNRLSRTQNEVHNKILDRFGNSEELLAYIKTPAGSKFLESAPIPLHAEQATQNTPMNRILWSIQLGVVVVAGGLGMLLISGRFDPETAQGLFAMGAIGTSVGVGFIASAVVSMVVSRRLGLGQVG